MKKKLENRRRYKNEDYHRKNHNRHSNIDLSAVLVCNFFLLMPYIVLMYWNFEEKIFGKKVYIGKIILKSIQIAFLSSLTIELLQLFLRLGTFQISDLFFNTIGGLAGGIIYFLVNAMAERIRRMRN